MASYPEPLELAFQQVEEESERRAMLEDEWTIAPRNTGAPPSVVARERRRASISISKLGELAPGGHFAPAHATAEHSTSNADFHPSHLSCSAAILGADIEEETGMSQIEYIPQTTTISTAVRKLLPRTPSRAQFATVVSSIQESSCVAIRVSIEEAAMDGQPHTGAVACGPGGHKLLPGRWAGRAKSLTKRFRRRSAGPLVINNSS